MADRIYPSAKPASVNSTTTAAAAANPSFPAPKAQLYNAYRPAYRPQPPPRKRRSCCCACCLWTTLIVVLLLFLAAVAGAILWVLYRPQRPTFSVSSFQVSQFNLSTSSSQINSKFNLTINARNPNKKLVFIYDPVAVVITADGVDVGDGSLPAFIHDTKNTTTLRTTIGSTGRSLDGTSFSVLKSDLKNKNNLPLKIRLDTKVRVKMGGMKTSKVGVRISCGGVKAPVPTGKKAATTATTDNVKCKVDLRIKIWKWTF